MLLTGILTLPLVYVASLYTFGKRFALIAMFLLAICPWHIVLSRWGLESNLLPFVFVIGYVCLLKSKFDNKWFVISCIFFALCLYAYGSAYVAVPIFLLCAIPIMLHDKRISSQSLLIGFIVFVIVSAPILLFLLVNTLQLNSIQIGFITIPRLPSQPRYEAMAAIFSNNLFKTLIQNLLILIKTLFEQTDRLSWNIVEPYGYFYTFTFPLAIIGATRLVCKSDKLPEQLLLVCWIVASLAAGVLQPVNINRINLIFIPLIICIAIFLIWISERIKMTLFISICVFLVSFVFFTRDYHGEQYRQEADKVFFTGFLQALDFVHRVSDKNAPICVTEFVNMPYIFILFSEKMNPADYLRDVTYVDPHAPFRHVRSFGRYAFGLENWPEDDRRAIYILPAEEQPPNNNISYKMTTFNSYRVYIPNPER
jgi:hypothetical protein